MPRIMENYLPKFMEKYLPVTTQFDNPKEFTVIIFVYLEEDWNAVIAFADKIIHGCIKDFGDFFCSLKGWLAVTGFIPKIRRL